jgi:nucleoside 2-deoxyribosyltransferase
MPPKKVIYLAASSFNARETIFNSHLVEELEDMGYFTHLPQRDGFEFGDLSKALKGKLPDHEISSAVLNIIYFYDMGLLLPSSDVVLANLDEPLDEGVVVESTYAKLIDKFVIGLRTDVRSPYGTSDDDFGGMHFFPAYQCHQIITQHIPCMTPNDRENPN